MDEIKKLSALAYELRKDVVDMIVEGKGGHIGGRYERYGYSGISLF